MSIDDKRKEDFIELVRELCWTDGIEPQGIFYIWYVRFFGAYHVLYEDERFKWPIDGRIFLTRIPVTMNMESAKEIAESLAVLIDERDLVIKAFEERSIRVKAMLTGSGAVLKSIRIGSVSRRNAITRVAAVAEVTLLGEGLELETLTYDIEESTKTEDWRRLAQAVKAQSSRRLRSDRGLMTDRVVLGAMAGIETARLSEMASFLATEPLPSTRTVGPGGPRDHWSPAQLRRLGHPVPPTIEALAVKDGRLVCRVRLSENVTWNDGNLTIARLQLPETTLSSMIGQRIEEVVDHDHLRGIGRITGAVQSRGMLKLKVETAEVAIASS